MVMTNSVANASYISFVDTSGTCFIGHFNSGTFIRDTNNNKIRFENSAGTGIVVVDTTNTRLGVGNSSPSYSLDISGDFRINTQPSSTTTPQQTIIGTSSSFIT